MKKNKGIKKLVDICIGECCNEGRVNESKVAKALTELKKLPLDQAVYAISEFLKGVKKHKNQYTLSIESSQLLTKTEVDKIVESLRKDYRFAEVKNIVNPDLFGGLKIRIGDDIFDDSIKGRIEQLGGAIHG